MQRKFICKNGVEYTIDDLSNNISKINHKGESQLLTYNDMSKMYLDFVNIKLSTADKEFITKYLLDHPFTTFLFGAFPKERISPKFTIEQFVAKISKSPAKLLSAFAGSILFLQSEGKSYETIMSGDVSTPQMKARISGFNAYYYKYNFKQYETFPAILYNDFLAENQAVYRNSTSVEQTLKLLNIPVDSKLYYNTRALWYDYLMGKNSQLTFKQAFPILNLTCTYSMYKLEFKDKEVEKLIKAHKHLISKMSFSWPHDTVENKVLATSEGRQIFDKIFLNKINTNPSLTARPQLLDYLKNNFNLANYVENSSTEKSKFVKWMMEWEHSTNEDLYKIEASEILKHNVDYCFQKANFLIKNFDQEFPDKPGISQELQPICKSVISRNVQTPKIFEQIRDRVSDQNIDPLADKISTLKFFHVLNKKAMEAFQKDGKPLPDSFSRFFAIYLDYINKNNASIDSVAKTLVYVIDHKDQLPAWILKETVDNESRRGDNFNQLCDNITQLEDVDKAIKLTKEQIYDKLYNANAKSENISTYLDLILDQSVAPNKLQYVVGTDYDLFKFFKSLKVDRSQPDYAKQVCQSVGKWIYEYCNLETKYKKFQSLKSIRNVRREDLSTLVQDAGKFNMRIDQQLEDKKLLDRTVKSYLGMINKNLSGEQLQEEIQNHKEPLNHSRQIIYEDENYTCFIPTFNDVDDWAIKMSNCMSRCYGYSYKHGNGLFLYICKKGQFDTALNATHLGLSESFSYGWGSSNEREWFAIAKQMEKNLEYNKATKDPKSKNYKKHPRGVLEGLKCNQCYSNGISREGQPLIYELETRSGVVLQTPKEREQLHNFTLELRKRLGFDGSSWFRDFDDVMEEYYAEKRKKIHK